MSKREVGQRREMSGTAYGFLAYGIWGLFPLYFHALAPSGAWEILVHRIVWTFVFVALVMVGLRDLAWVRPFLANRRLVIGIVLAAIVIAANWGVYVYAVGTGRTYQAALGYFLNPLITVGLGVFVLGEGLRRAQWIAVGIGTLAFVYMAAAGGAFPWISLVLAFSFAFYGLLKKKLGVTLTAMHSLGAETIVLLPAALGVLAWLEATGRGTLAGEGPGHTALLLLAGIVTAAPLLAFATAARMVPLVTLGLIQFLTPVIQLLIGVFALGEQVERSRWVGFAIVWVALVILTTDSLHAVRTSRRARLAMESDPIG